MDQLRDFASVERMLIEKAKGKKTPINGSIELLPLCNMNCDMCYVHMSRQEMEKKGRLRTAEEWLEIGRQMKEAGTLFLLLTGGEPLIYPEFKKVYLGFRDMGMVLTVNTNGTLIDEEWADFFETHPPRRINITLYGSNDETYRDLCHYPGGFEKVLNAVRLLKEKNVDVKLAGSLTPANFHELENIIEIAKILDCSIDFDEYMMPAERERDLPYPLQARVSPEAAAQARIRILKTKLNAEDFQRLAKAMIEKTDEFDCKNVDESARGMSCMAGNCSYTINWQGNMRPCVVFSNPSISVFDESFSSAWLQIKDNCSQIRIHEKCASCKLRIICRICPAAALLETGDFQQVPEYLCKYAETLYQLLQKEV